MYSEVNTRLNYSGKETGFVAKSCHMNSSIQVLLYILSWLCFHEHDHFNVILLGFILS
jgi:hypothetical protein